MSQVKKKFIGDNEVGAAKVRLENNSYLKARNAANSADVDLIKLNGSDDTQISAATSKSVKINADVDITLTALNNIVLAPTGSNYVVPDSDSARSLGNGSFRWQGLYANTTHTDTVQSDAGLLSLNANSGRIEMYASNDTIKIGAYGGSVAPVVQFNDKDESFNVGIKAPNTLAASYTLTLPPDDGTANQVLKTDGSGNLSWVTPSSGGTFATQTFVLGAGDITNQYVTLANTPISGSVHFMVKGAGVLLEGASYDYSVSGAQVNFLNDIATGGPSALVAGDVVQVKYSY